MYKLHVLVALLVDTDRYLLNTIGLCILLSISQFQILFLPAIVHQIIFFDYLFLFVLNLNANETNNYSDALNLMNTVKQSNTIITLYRYPNRQAMIGFN